MRAIASSLRAGQALIVNNEPVTLLLELYATRQMYAGMKPCRAAHLFDDDQDLG